MKFLIIGASGQDGQILKNLLINYGYTFFGVSHTKQKNSKDNYFWDGSVSTIKEIISKTLPDVVVNFSALHTSSLTKTKVSPSEMYSVNVLNSLKVLEQLDSINPNAIYVNSLSSHMYKATPEIQIDENTELNPRNFYGLTKVHALNISENLSTSLKIINLIMFNHESEYRSDDFITKNISNALAKVYLGKSNQITVNNALKSEDFSDAYDFMEALVYLCENKYFGRFVLSSGKLSSIENLINLTAKKLDLDDYEIVSKNSKKIDSLKGVNKKLLSTGFKFNSNIINALYRMTMMKIQNEK